MRRQLSCGHAASVTTMRLACGILLISAFALAQLTGSGVIAGTIIEAATGDPVRKAIVTLTLQGSPPTWATTRTDGSGRFRFEALPAGKYGLRATRNGLGTATYGANSARETGELISLGGRDIREGLTLRFVRTATIAGHVLDAEGDPLPGAAVTLLRPTRNLGERVLANYQTVNTDDRGEYRISGVDIGQYYLLASPQNARAVPNVLYAAKYYGGARESKDSRVLNVRSGDNLTGFDFLLNPEPAYRIHGRVTGVPNLSTATASPENKFALISGRNQIDIRINPVGEGAQRFATGTGASPPEYRFEFGDLIGGVYRVEARVHFGDKTWAASQQIDSSQAANEITLALAPATDIAGVLRIEGQTEPAHANLQVALVRYGARFENISARPDAEGNFTLKQVPPGEWVLNVNNMPPGSFLKSATFGDKDVRFTRFSTEPDSQGQFNISVSLHPARLEGEVDAGALDSKRAGIVLAPVGSFHNLARFYYGGIADGDGKFHLENLAPGKYRIFALEKTAPADFRNPEAADQLGALGEEIELTEGQTLQIHPKLIPELQAREALPAEIR